jgi:hypothetical protein
VTWPVLAPIIIVGGALVIIALERASPYDDQRLFRRGLVVDLIGYALVQSAILSVVINGIIAWLDGSPVRAPRRGLALAIRGPGRAVRRQP